MRRRPSPALQIRLRAPRVGLGPWSPDPCFRLDGEKPTRGACPGGGQGAPHSLRGSPLPVGAPRGRFWRLGAQGGAPADSPLGATGPLPASEAPRSLREAEHFPGLGGGRCCPHPRASGLLSRGRRSLLPITSHHPHPEPLPKSRLPTSPWSKLSAPCSGLWPGLASSGLPRALGDAGRHLRAAGTSLRPALTQLPGCWAPMWPSPSPGSLPTVAARRLVPPRAWRRWSPGAPTQGTSHRGARATLWPAGASPGGRLRPPTPDPNHPP